MAVSKRIAIYVITNIVNGKQYVGIDLSKIKSTLAMAPSLD